MKYLQYKSIFVGVKFVKYMCATSNWELNIIFFHYFPTLIFLANTSSNSSNFVDGHKVVASGLSESVLFKVEYIYM